jgi:hypothetical protein
VISAPNGRLAGLLGEDVEALHQRQTGRDHGRELAGEDRQVLVLTEDGRAELGIVIPAFWLSEVTRIFFFRRSSSASS